MKKGLLIFFLSAINIAYAQKKPLDHNVYDSWQSISSRQLTANGQFAMYNIAPQQGDTVLYVSNLKTQANNVFPRAFKANFTNDSKYAAFIIRPAYAELRKARIQKKKAADLPKDTLGILNLINNQTLKIADIKSYKLPEKGFGHIAYLSSKVDTANKAAVATKKPEGAELVVRNLNTAAEKSFKNVTDYFFSKNGNLLAFVSVGSKNDAKDAGVYLLNTEKGTLKTLIKGKGTFKNFAFDEEDEHLAFVGEQSPEKQEIKNYNVYYSSLSLDTAQVIVDYDMTGLPSNWSINGDSRVNFSKDGSKLFFGIAPIKKPKDTTIVDFEVAKVDIWHYKDDYLQTQQLKNADRESKRGYLAVVDVYSGLPKVLPLATSEIPDAIQLNEGDSQFVLASTDFGRRIESQWTGKTSKDYYLVNTKTGARKKIIDNLNGRVYPSPEGNFIVYYDNNKSAWFSYQIATDKTYSLAVSDIKFYNEENDLPDTPNAYGLAAFTQDDKSVLIYDKYDIWQFALDGKSTPKNITNNFGRQNKISFRYIKTDPESKFVKNNEIIYLNAFNEISKENGLYRKPLNASKNPELLTQGKYTFTNFTKAKNADVFIYEKSSYIESPNLYTTVDFKSDLKLSDTNPQQKNYNWGTSELVKWTTPQGFKSEGILYKPEDFDPNKKYPMIVYFYEKLSDGLYNYIAPQPTPSRLNISFFVSNGYLVFAPDISYLDGNPGPSAVEYINSGVENLKKNTWVDGSKIGIQGQSWGGYQVAYLITQNDMYAAAWAGAPVVNMTSAYGGIRWDTGLNRQFQYEKTQSRIGGTLWEKQDLYIKNSPLFMFPKVNTPVVIMANDADGAVPWYQGIEMFTALRRLGKPVWMLNYNNEAHNLVQRQNRKDIQIREQQFFDHYLKGAKAPVWMTSGVPATEKGKTWGFELTDSKP